MISVKLAVQIVEGKSVKYSFRQKAMGYNLYIRLFIYILTTLTLKELKKILDNNFSNNQQLSKT